MRLRQCLLAGMLGLAVSGCGTSDNIIRKQTEMEARIEQLVQANAANTARVSELSALVGDLRGEVAKNVADIDGLKPAVRDIKASLESAPRRAEESSSSPSRIVLVNRDVAPGDGQSLEQDAYMKAYGLFSANNYPAAIEAFHAFIKDHPASEYAGNAQYWIGECYYTRRDYGRALAAFAKVVEKYPKGNKAPDALLKIAFSQISLNEPGKARATLESVVEKYPRSPAAAKARERLSR